MSASSGKKAFQIDGIVPVIPTPFTDEDRIDWDALGQLIDFARAADACAICLPAYASEFYKLSDEESRNLIARAAAQASGQIPVVAQVNHFGAQHVVESARFAQQAGAAALCVAVPRLFPLTEDDLGRYFDRILRAVSLPLIIQDFNPGGVSVSPSFISRLHEAHPHFMYVKLEEPAMAAKVQAIREETMDQVGVLEGWGGMYTLELVPAGISGVVPSLGLTDLLARIFRLARDNRRDEAFEIFKGVLPQIVFSLQNLELYHHVEKLLLKERGILKNPAVRDAGLRLSPHDEQYIRFLNGKILALLDHLDLPRNPAQRSTVKEI